MDERIRSCIYRINTYRPTDPITQHNNHRRNDSFERDPTELEREKDFERSQLETNNNDANPSSVSKLVDYTATYNSLGYLYSTEERRAMVLFRIATCLLAILPSTVAFARTSTTRAFIRPSVLTAPKTPPFTTAASITSSRTSLTMADSDRYSLPDQPARFAKAKLENNKRFLDITTVYDPSFLKGKRVAVTGANRGIGLQLATELTEAGAQVIAIVRKSSEELDALKPVEIIKGIELTDDEMCEKLAGKIKGGPIDILINNAGYFMVNEEKIDSLDFAEELKMINICALGPMRVSSSLVNGGLLVEGSKIIMITSQGGSVGWRTTQNPDGGDYGHHMSKAAANMSSMLLAQELKKKSIAVGILHPGFNKTEMTAKYKEIWEVEGAVDPSVGAKRIMYETGKLSMDTTGKFINCEDGLEIPW